eukprot:923582-Prymnesium_polylepis.1
MDSDTLTTGELGAMCTPRLAAKTFSRRETPAILLTAASTAAQAGLSCRSARDQHPRCVSPR